MTLAECYARSSGLVNIYTNVPTTTRREWVAATFDGQSVTARREFDGNGVLRRAQFYREDPTAGTYARVGTEFYSTTGVLTGRLRFTGDVRSTTLTAGQSQTLNVTQTDLVPGTAPDVTTRHNVSFDGVQTITLPQGRVEACRITIAFFDANNAPLSTTTEYRTRGADLVKSYNLTQDSTSSTLGQTSMLELDSTNSNSLQAGSAVATTTPTLYACSVLPAGLDLRLTASPNSSESASARRTTAAAVVLGTNTVAVQRRDGTTNVLQSTYHYDPAIGLLMPLGVENADGTTGTTVSGVPDLRSTAVGASLSYTATYTDYPSGAATSATTTFTHLGHERVTTPAGTFDTCKVRYVLDSGHTETHWLLPSRHFVRLETVSPGGSVRTVREQL